MDEAGIAALFPAAISVCIASEAMQQARLFPEEEALVTGSVPKRRNEFTGGRTAAHAALARLGAPPGPILRSSTRAPIWPAGFVGSITHCAGFCCAVAARTPAVTSIGLDAEQGKPLEGRLAEMICRPEELEHFAGLTPLAGTNWPKVTFSAKEAFYKAVNPVLGAFLGFHEASVRFSVDASGDRGAFQVEILTPEKARSVPAAQVTGRWTVEGPRVYAGVTWLPG